MPDPTPKLKKCPFCEGEGFTKSGFYDFERHWVECDSCEATTCGKHETKEQAITAWNTRPTEDRLVEALERVKTRIDNGDRISERTDGLYNCIKKALEAAKEASHE